MISSETLIPMRCPSTRFKPLALAQRPLPSMIMATCFGRIIKSNLHNFLFFFGSHLIDFGGKIVGEFLNVMGPLLAVVFGNLPFLLQFFKLVDRLASGMTNRHPAFFRVVF